MVKKRIQEKNLYGKLFGEEKIFEEGVSIMSAFSRHIGSRIKLYRRNKQMTQSDFAKLIHKSKSAVSKYECGEISIDMDTLYEIAKVLEISIWQLLDFPMEKEPIFPGLKGFFHGQSRFYTYYLNKNSSRIVRGVLEINQLEDCEYSTVLFADVKEYDHLYGCYHLYYGDIHYSDSYVNLVMQNQANKSERIFLILANPYSNNANFTVGMISGISAQYLVPVSLKIILSKTKLEEDEDLRNALQFTKEDFNSMKRTFCFSIDRFIEL